jgi:hypothetical protein
MDKVDVLEIQIEQLAKDILHLQVILEGIIEQQRKIVGIIDKLADKVIGVKPST